MTLEDFLRSDPEPLPEWLGNLRTGQQVAPCCVLHESRVVFYPGSGFDGHAVKAFGSSRAAHCFVMADYRRSRQEILQQLADDATRFLGYRTLAIQHLGVDEIVPRDWRPHVNLSEVRPFEPNDHWVPYAMLVLLEREAGYAESHGPDRLAILFVGGDGIATYDALFAQPGSRPPYAALLDDLAFDSNYSRFGAEGLLCTVAQRSQVFPRFLLLGQHTLPWPGYQPVPAVLASNGGMYGRPRRLWALGAGPVDPALTAGGTG